MSIKSIIESVLFVSGSDGCNINELKKVTDLSADEIRQAIKELKTTHDQNSDSGLIIKEFNNVFYMLTKAENKPYIAKLNGFRIKNPLTTSLMETLAIIAYNSPCTAAKIQQIRDLDPSAALNKLISLELISQIGRATTPGCPYLYEPTQKFFTLFGIKSLNELPKFEELINFDDFNEIDDFFDSSRE